MQELNNADGLTTEVDVTEMIAQLNNEQKCIFDSVTNTLLSNNKNKTTAVTAPTGLAAFNVDGLTVHRLFQLPVEHGGKPIYEELSDKVLKILRTELKNVMLFIIDEVSMISNVILTCIHLRLSEISNTKNTSDRWFGGKHIILMGDLLQLPPVIADSAYLTLKKDKVQKYLGSVGAVNL
ncbi:ATP-dependent DNA helicase PIF1-like [Diprion similis]|uniref:ATP-dependent DNA helicase PIF1-like n=1 Tax=Diprion similis TaxID=362088 RepID=UPI001EF7C332|nr:ATP-dependent DNA helicase PIF1-like [Diprion similis]